MNIQMIQKDIDKCHKDLSYYELNESNKIMGVQYELGNQNPITRIQSIREAIRLLNLAKLKLEGM